MHTSRPNLRTGLGRLVLAKALQTKGNQVRLLASSPLAQAAPLGGRRPDTGLMGSTRQTGAYQTACDHNQQRPGTMNAIIYTNTVQVSLSHSVVCCSLTLSYCGCVERLLPHWYSRQYGGLLPRATLLFILADR